MFHFIATEIKHVRKKRKTTFNDPSKTATTFNLAHPKGKTGSKETHETQQRSKRCQPSHKTESFNFEMSTSRLLPNLDFHTAMNQFGITKDFQISAIKDFLENVCDYIMFPICKEK